MWERTKVGWHVAMYGLLAIVAVSFVIDDGVSTRQRWIGLALVAALTVAYTVLARPVLGQERIGPAMAYIVVAWACFFCLMALHDSAFILLFALFPQVWALLPTRAAIVTTIVGITGLVVAQAAAAGWSTEAFVDAGVGGLVSLGISILLGLWITGVIRESDQRATLIAELERTRAELAAAEHDRGCSASGSDWRTRSTTRWRRGSPASPRSRKRPRRPSIRSRKPPVTASCSSSAPLETTSPKLAPWSPI